MYMHNPNNNSVLSAFIIMIGLLFFLGPFIIGPMYFISPIIKSLAPRQMELIQDECEKTKINPNQHPMAIYGYAFSIMGFLMVVLGVLLIVF